MARFAGSRYESISAIQFDFEGDGTVQTLLESREIIDREDLEHRLFEYTIRENDTLDLLSFSLSGREDLWWVISEINADTLDFPLDLTVGDKIFLPYPEVFEEILS